VAEPDNRARPGRRERKKALTQASIQREALRLFREQGYEATTMGEIAEAADVSASTLFRYFPTKEELVRWDEYDPMLVEVVRAQPARLSPIAALRAGLRQMLGKLSTEDRALLRQRVALMAEIPLLRVAGADPLSGPAQLLAEMLAERAGRRPDELPVRIAVGAMLGAGVAVMLAAAQDPEADVIEMLDDALMQLELGLKL
jgi:AcrR family transcriptional regulator